jgi:CBS domain-containing protein
MGFEPSNDSRLTEVLDVAFKDGALPPPDDILVIAPDKGRPIIAEVRPDLNEATVRATRPAIYRGIASRKHRSRLALNGQRTTREKPMNARDVMSRNVVSVTSDTPMRKIAALLLEKRISAVPVVDGSGAPVGMVSEGDLTGRSEVEREARQDWWLRALAEGEALNAEFLASLNYPTARDLMSAPIISVREETSLEEIAQLLTTHRIKRVPVVHDGRIVGIVSRADLVRALAAKPHIPLV